MVSVQWTLLLLQPIPADWRLEIVMLENVAQCWATMDAVKGKPWQLLAGLWDVLSSWSEVCAVSVLHCDQIMTFDNIHDDWAARLT